MGDKAFLDWAAQQPDITDADVPTRGDDAAHGLWQKIRAFGNSKPHEPNMVESFLGGGSEAASLGLNDEMSAYGNAALDRMLGAFGVGDYEGKSFGELKDARLEQTRNMNSALREAHPIANLAGQVAGAAAPAILTGGGTAAPTLMQAATRGAATSGAQSAAQGFGEGEGGFVNRLERAATQGALGTVLGGVLGYGGAALTKSSKTAATLPMQKAATELRKLTDDAYKAADNAGVVYSGNDIVNSLTTAMNDVRTGTGYWAPEVYKHDETLNNFMDKIMQDVQSQTTQGGLRPRDMTFSQLEQMRKGLKAKMLETKEPRIMALVKAVDNVINTNSTGSELAQAAREASRIERNTALFDTLLKNADINARASGGSKVTKFKQAAAKMLTDKKTSKFLDPEETEVLNSILDTGFSGEIERVLTRLDPSGSQFSTMLSALWVMKHPIAGTAAIGAGRVARHMGETASEASLANARNVISRSGIQPPMLSAGQGPVAKGVAAVGASQAAPSIMDMIMPSGDPQSGELNMLQELQRQQLMQQGGGQ